MPHCPHCFRGPPIPGRVGVWVDVGVFALLGCARPAVIPVFGFGVCCGHHAHSHRAHTASCPPGVSVQLFPEFLWPHSVTVTWVPPMATVPGSPQIPVSPMVPPQPSLAGMLIPEECLGDSGGAGGTLWIHPSVPKFPSSFFSPSSASHGAPCPFGNRKNFSHPCGPFPAQSKPVQALFPILVEK